MKMLDTLSNVKLVKNFRKIIKITLYQILSQKIDLSKIFQKQGFLIT